MKYSFSRIYIWQTFLELISRKRVRKREEVKNRLWEFSFILFFFLFFFFTRNSPSPLIAETKISRDSHSWHVSNIFADMFRYNTSKGWLLSWTKPVTLLLTNSYSQQLKKLDLYFAKNIFFKKIWRGENNCLTCESVIVCLVQSWSTIITKNRNSFHVWNYGSTITLI